MIFIYLLFFYWHQFFGHHIDIIQYGSFTLGFLFLGIISANSYDKERNTSDSKEIVIDEVVGMMITYLPIIWLTDEQNNSLAFSGWIQPLLAFLLFRFFDVLKPWPISWVDQNIKGGLGVMLDDVLAGILAAICFLGIVYGSIWIS